MATKTQATATKTTTTATKAKEQAPKDNTTEMEKVVKNLPTKSAKIRALDAAGYTRSQIANFLGIRYQHVRNVLITPLKSKDSTPAKS